MDRCVFYSLGVCLNCKISRCFKATVLCLSCIHCLTRHGNLKGRFRSLVAKNLCGSGRKDWPEALLSFWCAVKLKQTWGFLSSEQTSHSSCLCRIYPIYSGAIQTRAICKGMCRCTLESDCFGLELLKTQEGEEQKFFCSVVNSETRMFAFHTLFLRTTENCLPRNDLAKFKALHFILERSNMDI